MKTTKDLNKELSSRCGVVLLTKEEATEALLRPIRAAGREQARRSPKESQADLLDDKITITIPRYWQTTARDYHEFKNMAYYYEEAGLKVKYEEIGCSGDYYAIFWIGKKPTKIINEAKETFEN
jgi:hypothetical protein